MSEAEPQTDLGRAHADLREFRKDALDEWPDPLNYLATFIIRQNAQEWLVEKPGTFGEEIVREQGYTNNQLNWLHQVADRMDGGYWMCPYCQTVTVGREKPPTCGECGADELVDANVEFAGGDRA